MIRYVLLNIPSWGESGKKYRGISVADATYSRRIRTTFHFMHVLVRRPVQRPGAPGLVELCSGGWGGLLVVLFALQSSFSLNITFVVVHIFVDLH